VVLIDGLQRAPFWGGKEELDEEGELAEVVVGLAGH